VVTYTVLGYLISQNLITINPPPSDTDEFDPLDLKITYHLPTINEIKRENPTVQIVQANFLFKLSPEE
jgi:hypothetical protein